MPSFIPLFREEKKGGNKTVPVCFSFFLNWAPCFFTLFFPWSTRDSAWCHDVSCVSQCKKTKESSPRFILVKISCDFTGLWMDGWNSACMQFLVLPQEAASCMLKRTFLFFLLCWSWSSSSNSSSNSSYVVYEHDMGGATHVCVHV